MIKKRDWPVVLLALIIMTVAFLLGYQLSQLKHVPEPDCRHQWTSDTRFVKHCNFYDGRGYMEVRDE